MAFTGRRHRLRDPELPLTIGSDIIASKPVSKPIVENWENEGGSVPAAAEPDSLGIVRVMSETYAVGGYTYTNLTDAIAQGRRMQQQSAVR